MKNETPNQEALMEQLETELTEIYGREFLMNLQDICGLKSMRSLFGKSEDAKNKRTQYVSMLRGAWYASHQARIDFV